MLSRFLQGKKPPSQARVGITIGTQGILGVRVEQPFDQRPRLVAASYHPAEVDREWPKALRHLTEAMSAEGLPAVVQVHSQLASLLQLDLPNVPDAERASALKFRAREISPIPLDDMVLDYVEVPGMRARGTETMGYCAIARRSQMSFLRDAMKDAGLRLEAIDVKDMALRHLLARVQADGENGAVVFVGAHDSRISAARHDQLYLFRSSNITIAQLDESGGERMEALMLEIQRTLDFYDSNFTDPPPRQLWLLPEWPSMPRLAQHLGAQLRLPVRELTLDKVLDGVEHLAGLPTDLASLAVGAALRPQEADA